MVLIIPADKDEQATVDELIKSLKACVKGEACEECIECGNSIEYCWASLMRRAAEALEQLKQKDGAE